ncbi:MAG: hypothetical protein HY866_13420, partial [Chloroflexi bacterium]|nr:hypothetical protein [Chloroflexota bacterium]
MPRHTSLLLLILITLFPVSALYAQDNPPHMGSGIVFIDAPHKGIWIDGVLSHNGDFLVVISYLSGGAAFPEIYLYDLREIDPDGPSVALEPSATFRDEAATDSTGVLLSASGIAFSPDDTRLAIMGFGAIRVLSVPDLKPLDQLSRLSLIFGDVIWSADGHTLLAADRLGHTHLTLTLWNLDQNTTQSHSATFPDELWQSSLVPFAGGWLVDGGGSFLFCDTALNCQSVSHNQTLRAVDFAHEIIVTGDGRHTTPTTAWTRNSDGVFVPDTHFFDFLGENGVPESFSPDGRYMSVMRWIDVSGGQSYTAYDLWELEQHTLLYEASQGRGIRWMGVDNYYLPGSGGILAHPGSAEPVSLMRDFEALEVFAGLTTDEMWGRMRTYHEVWG